MKKFFITLAVAGIALLLPSQAEAQTKAFRNWYTNIADLVSTNRNYKNISTDVYFGKNSELDKNNPETNGLQLYFNACLPNLQHSPSIDEFDTLASIACSRKYKMVMHSNEGDTTYDIFKGAQRKGLCEYLVIINKGKQEAVIYDFVGDITSKDVLNLTGIKVRPKTVGLIGSGN